LGILQEIHPSLIWKDSLRPLLESLNQPEPETWRGVPGLRHVLRRVALSYLLWFGHLAPAVIKDIASRLSFSADLRDALLAASFLWQDLPSLVDAKPSVVAARLDNVPLLAVCALNLQSTSTHWSVSESVSNYLSNWRHIKTKTTGHDLKKRGLPPGPAYQSILRRLREAWLDGEVKTAQEERALLESLISGVE
jgi:tRNA nucleotidyltransferase (CCA-adding enzyme)